MPAFKQLPPSLRYFKARLRPLAQPLLWGPVLVVALGMFALWTLSVNPEWLSTDGDEALGESNVGGSNTLSAEDSAIAADIDTSNKLSSLLNTPVIRNQGLFDELRKRRFEADQPATTPKLPPPETPKLTPGPESLLNPEPTNSLLKLNATAGSDQLSEFAPVAREQQPLAGESAFTAPLNGRNSGSLNDSSLPANPLKAAMEQYLNANGGATFQKQPATKDTDVKTSPALPQTAGPGLEPLNPVPTAQSSGLASSFPRTALAPAEPPSGVWGNNPNQTNLSNSGLASAPALVPERAPLAAPNNDLQQILVPASTQGSTDLRPGFPVLSQPSPSNFTVTPLAENRDTSAPLTNQPLSAPSPLPGRYAGTRETAPSSNP